MHPTETDALLSHTSDVALVPSTKRRYLVVAALASLGIMVATVSWRVTTATQYGTRSTTQVMDCDPDASASTAIQRLNGLTSTMATTESQAPKSTKKGAFTIAPQLPQEGCAHTVLIFRHCDDYVPNPEVTLIGQDGNKHCSEIGQHRSEYLATLFDIPKTPTDRNHDSHSTAQQPSRRWPTPTHLYALTKSNNRRQVDTLTPLARQSYLFITTVEFPGLTELQSAVFQAMAASPSSSPSQTEGLRQRSQCGSTVSVVTWKHHFIPSAAAALGCGPQNGCPPTWTGGDWDFDSVWEMQYTFHRRRPSNDENSREVVEGEWRVHGTTAAMGFDPVSYAYHHDPR